MTSVKGCSETRVRDVVADETLDGGEGVAELCGRRRLVGLEQRAEQSAVELGVKDRDAYALWGERVGIGRGRSLDKAVQAETAEVVAHLGGAVVLAEEPGHRPAVG